jgi:signal transduction histidine kinase
MPYILADEVQIQQVILNLVRNGLEAVQVAERANGKQRYVSITTATDGPAEIVVRVADSGTGLAEQPGEDLFEPFFTTKEHGTGMGLAITKSIVTAHGGRIWHQPNPQGGATFSFALPAVQAHDDDSV